MAKHRHEKMLEDADIERWYRNVARGSENTADVQLRGLGRFCEWAGTSPKGFLEKNEKERGDLILDYVTYLEKNGKAGSYIASSLKPVKSWLRYTNLELRQRIKVRFARTPVTLKNEKIPSQEELKAILRSATKGSRVCCSVIAHSGVRPEVLGNYRGKDGLKLGDFPELELNEGHAEFTVIPSRIIVREELSKAGHEYFTFIGPEGAEYIKDYLNDRMRNGEKLNENSPLIIPKWDNIHFITTTNIGDQVRQAIRNAGFKWRPYVLRAYFASQTLLAESKEGISRDYRVFFMGHKGDIEHVYTLRKVLSPETIEDMRKSYMKVLKFIETEERGIKEEDYQKMLRDSAMDTLTGAFGIMLTEEQKEELRNLEVSEYQKRLGEIFKDKRADMLNNGNKHKTIPERELETYLNKGWELVQIYPKGDKAVIKLPS